MVSKVRSVLVQDLHILSLFNGTFAMSKQGPKSAENNANATKKIPEMSKSKKNQALESNISKSKTSGVYLKHMVSEIILNLACNKFQEGPGNTFLIPHLVTNNMISFLLDLKNSILSETSKAHELAVESEINCAQVIAKIFISTNPILIHDGQKYDGIKLIACRLLSEDTHHELLVYEALLSLTNISSCL